MSGRSSRKAPSPLYKHLVKLVFFVITFVVFVILQNSQGFFGEVLGEFHRGLSDVPWWMVPLAAVGAMSILWILFLGVCQFIERIRSKKPTGYGGLISNPDTDDESDEEQGGRRPVLSRRTKLPLHNKAPVGGSPRRSVYPSQGHGSFGGPSGGYHGGLPRQQGRGPDGQDSKGPTDVDVTVHPVDTTIAAGGDARVSPTYNVSLMSFPNGNPPRTACPPNSQVYPTAPTMEGGPAFFKRSFQ